MENNPGWADDPWRALPVAVGDLGAHEAGQAAPPPYAYTRQQENELPREVAVTAIDPDLDEADGRSYARRLTSEARAVAEHRLPVAMPAGERERLARKLLYAAWTRRHRYSLTLPRDYLFAAPGDVLLLPIQGREVRVRIERMELDPAGVIRIEGFRDDTGVWRDNAQALGGVVPRSQTLKTPVATTAALLDLPILDESDGDGAVMLAALYADDPARWNGAALHQSLDGGASYSQVGEAAVMATAGASAAALPAGPLWRFDRATVATVTLAAGSLESRSEAQLLADPLANLCVIGEEVLQFATATLVGPKTYQLSTLLRGLRGTEWAVAAHQPGEAFVLFDFALLRVPLTLGQLGLSLLYKAPTAGQSLAEAAVAAHLNAGRTLRPRAPVHLAAHRDPASGDWSARWQRRSRLGGGFALGSPAPLAEQAEAYEAEVLDGPGGAVVRTLAGLASPALTYSAGQQSADFGAPQASLTLRVYQLSAAVGRGFAREESFG